MASDDYTGDNNPLYQGGLNKEFVDIVYAVGGLSFVREVLKTTGRQIALKCHADKIGGHKLPSAQKETVDKLVRKAALLLDAHGLDDSQLEQAIREMPAGGSLDQETQRDMAEALAEMTRLEGELQTAQEANDALHAQYSKLVTEDARGLRNIRGIETILRETVRLLQKQGGKGGNPAAEQELRELKGRYSTLEGQYRTAVDQKRVAEDVQAALRRQKTDAEADAQRARSALQDEQTRYRTLEGRFASTRDLINDASARAGAAEARTRDITAALGTIQGLYTTTRQEYNAATGLLARLCERNAALETRLTEAGVDPLDIASIIGEGTATLHNLQISRYQIQLKQSPDNPLLYVLLLQEILEKDQGVPKDGEAEYAKEMIYHLERLRALDTLCDLAVQYKERGNLAAAEFILVKPYRDGTEHPRTYETLAEIIDQQNTGNDPGRSAWAAQIRHDARRVRFRKKIAHYRNILAEDDRNILAYTGIVKTLMEKTDGNPIDGERNYAYFALFKLRELGAEERVIHLAQEYHTNGQSAAAEFILDKLVKDETRTAAAYTSLATVVRGSANYTPKREQWAQFLDWKAQVRDSESPLNFEEI
ncbi:MAG: hypothetical protein AABX82_08585 [Nanoarchaeota archaeon]